MTPGTPSARAGQAVLRVVFGLLAVAAVVVVARQGAKISLAVLAVVLLGVGAGLVWLSRRDVVLLLTIELVLLFLVPEYYVLVGPLRSAGNPAQLVGMILFALWAAARLLDLIPGRRWHPARWTMWLFAITVFTAYAAALLRPLTPIESGGATRSFFPVIGALGIAMLAIDGLENRAQVDAVLRRLVILGGLTGVIGIMEFTFPGFSWLQVAHLPGLTINTDIAAITRSGFARVEAAAAHPIEYAVALSFLAPLALHYTLHGPTRGRRQLYGLCLMAILAAIPMSVSRSGIIAVALAIVVYAVALTGRQKLTLVLLGVVGLGLFRAAVPGLLGTLRGLLTIGNNDPSISGRTEDYARIPGLLEHYWLLGRGLGTFQPTQYFFLDNQFLYTLLEGGVVAFLALLVLFVVPLFLSRGVRHRTGDPVLRSLAQALTAAMFSLAFSAATFDEFSFRQAFFGLFLLIGCTGALWGFAQSEPKRWRSGELREPEATPVIDAVDEPAAEPQPALAGAGAAG